jgi:hypothetical protein
MVEGPCAAPAGTDTPEQARAWYSPRSATGGLVALACRRPVLPVLLAIAPGPGAAHQVTSRFSVSTDTGKLFPADLPRRQAETRLAAALPQRGDLVAVVVDGATPGLAERGAAAMQQWPELFRPVRRPDAGPHFERHALLHLSTTGLRQATERRIEAQPLLGTLAADPSRRGILSALGLMLQGLLLSGMGVAFDVCDAMAWKAGGRERLSTAMTRGMPFSSLTTFGTLALSSHPGTVSMGVPLALSLLHILAAVLLTLPAMPHALARQESPG